MYFLQQKHLIFEYNFIEMCGTMGHIDDKTWLVQVVLLVWCQAIVWAIAGPSSMTPHGVTSFQLIDLVEIWWNVLY